jgi:hypothetical protein
MGDVFGGRLVVERMPVVKELDSCHGAPFLF